MGSRISFIHKSLWTMELLIYNPLQFKGLAGSVIIRKSNNPSPAQVVVPQALAWGVAGASSVPIVQKTFSKKSRFPLDDKRFSDNIFHMKNELKKRLLNIANHLSNYGAYHSRRGNMIRARLLSKLELGLLELRWQLTK